MPTRVNYDGQRFGRLLVIETIRAHAHDSKLRCRCECGGEVTALAYNVRNGNTSSCGCLAQESRSATGKIQGLRQGKINATHGMSNTPTYAAWRDAKNRCFRPKTAHFDRYGGRGITMCAAWAESFDAFLSDMGKRPAGMTLDRINVDGNYDPGNCRWATRSQQMRNTHRARCTEDDVRTMRRTHSQDGIGATQLALQYGMKKSNVQSILARKTWADVADQ